MASLWKGAFDGPPDPRCKAEDVVRQGIPCQPSEGKYDGKPQSYCKRCGKKIVP